MLGKILFIVLGLSLPSICFALTHGQAQGMLSGAGTFIIITEFNLRDRLMSIVMILVDEYILMSIVYDLI